MPANRVKNQPKRKSRIKPFFALIKEKLSGVGHKASTGMYKVYERRRPEFSHRFETESKLELSKYFKLDELDDLNKFFSEYPYHPMREQFVYFEDMGLEEKEKLVKRLKLLLDDIRNGPRNEIVRFGRLAINTKHMRELVKRLNLWKMPVEKQIITLLDVVRNPRNHEELSELVGLMKTHKDRLLVLSALMSAADIEHEVLPFPADPKPHLWIPLLPENVRISFDAEGKAIIGVEKGGKKYWWRVGGDVKHVKDPDDPTSFVSYDELEELTRSESFVNGLNALLLKMARRKAL